MPIAPKWQKVLDDLIKQYGKKKGTGVFYALMKKRGIDYTKEEITFHLEDTKFTYQIPFELITESAKDTPEGLEIEGVAVSASVSRNGIKYVADELKDMKSMKGIPILDSHNQDTIEAIKGKVTKDWYDEGKKARMFRGLITDPKVAEMIKSGLINRVSIGAVAKELLKEVRKNATYYIAKGLEVLELSLVAVAGVASATFTHSMTEAFKPLEGKSMGDGENIEINVKDDAKLSEAIKAREAAEAELKTAKEKARQLEEASKDTTSKTELDKITKEKKELMEKLDTIEAEKHKEMAIKCAEKMIEAGFVKEEDKKAELERNEKLDHASLSTLYERVKGFKPEEEGDGKGKGEGEPEKQAESKGKLLTVKDLEEVSDGDFIVERGRDGVSLWQMPKEADRINRGDQYGVR
jgi:hypothetical protein